MIPMLNQVAFRSTNPELSCKFYEQLGFTFRTENIEQKGQRHKIMLGNGIELSISKKPESKKASDHIRHSFIVDNVKTKIERLKENKIGAILRAVYFSPLGPYAILKDPDGNVIIIHERR